MNISIGILSSILSPVAVARNIMRSTPILDGQLAKNPTNISTPTFPRIQDIYVLLTQDHQALNTGRVFLSCSSFTRLLLEMMIGYSLLMGKDHVNAKQDALEHEPVRQHVGFFLQRTFNAYVKGSPNMDYRDEDLLVHFAGVWIGGKREGWFEVFWARRDGRGGFWSPEEKEPSTANTLEARYPTIPKHKPSLGRFMNASRPAPPGSAY
jgi:hypothetical protein